MLWYEKNIKTYGGVKKPSQVRHIIAVSSGKGGVGKTTITLQLALYLKDLGLRVGILDADIYGPNIMSFSEKTDIVKTLEPFYYESIPCASMARIVPSEQALMWRGPMIGKAAMQLLMDTPWPDLDILLVDCPPGTGDVHLTLLTEAAWVGYIAVTTPHIMAQSESLRVKKLFAHYGVPLLATLVNLHHVDCPSCGYAIPWLGENDQGIALAYHKEWMEGRKSHNAKDYMWVQDVINAITALPEAELQRREKLTIKIEEKK